MLEAAMSSSSAGAGRPCGTLFPWLGPGSWDGDDFRAGDSPLAAPRDGRWLVVHSSHAPLSPDNVRTRACDPLSPATLQGSLRPSVSLTSTGHLLMTQTFPVPAFSVPGMESPRSRDGLLLFFSSLGLSSSSAFLPSPSSPDLPLSHGPCLLSRHQLRQSQCHWHWTLMAP